MLIDDTYLNRLAVRCRGKGPDALSAARELADALETILRAWNGKTPCSSQWREDRLQECRIAACRAARRYDPARGVHFRTYLRQRLDQSVLRYRDAASYEAHKRQRRLQRLSRSIQQLREQGCDGDPETLAHRLNVSEADVLSALEWEQEVYSIDDDLREENDVAPRDRITEPGSSVEQQVIATSTAAERIDACRQALGDDFLRAVFNCRLARTIQHDADLPLSLEQTEEQIRSETGRSTHKLDLWLREQQIRDQLRGLLAPE